jgi:hypothetical protein
MEEWVIRQYQPLWVAMEDFADQGGELALAMKQARNDFNVKYRAVSGWACGWVSTLHT